MGVSTKYLNGYVTMFNFLDSLRFERNIANIKKTFVTACLQTINATFNSIRTEVPAFSYSGNGIIAKPKIYNEGDYRQMSMFDDLLI